MLIRTKIIIIILIIIFESEVRAIPTRTIQTTPRDVNKDSDELDKDLKSKN